MNLSQAATKAFGVLRSPNPYTVRPDSRSLAASLVKSLSLETRQNPSNLPEYSRSMASITIAESVAFFPVVYANCCTGWIDWASSRSFHPFRLVPVQSPYARLTCAVPYLATSASKSSMIAGCALSASISTASLAAFSLTRCLLRRGQDLSYHARLTKSRTTGPSAGRRAAGDKPGFQAVEDGAQAEFERSLRSRSVVRGGCSEAAAQPRELRRDLAGFRHGVAHELLGVPAPAELPAERGRRG